MSASLFEELKERGFIYQMTAEEPLIDLLNKEQVKFYVGFDPTGDSLHVGHLLPVMAMRRLQAAGHHPIVLVGGATGLVGDPSGKSEARPILTREKVAHNVACLRNQLARFISVENATFVDNNEWFGEMLYLDFLRDIGSKFSVNRMLQAESVKMRMESGISFLEFNYMILQAYDFHVLNRKYGCRLQMGGQDQWGNITCGTELVRRLDKDEVFGITIPLLMNSSGQKFGKSVGGAVWLDPAKTSVFDYYQFWRNTDDADVKRLLFLFTGLPTDEIERICEPVSGNINRAKELLACEATALAHGADEARKAFHAAGSKFGFADSGNAIPTASDVARVDCSLVNASEDLPTYLLPLADGEARWIVQLLADAGMCKSNGEARRLIQGGGAYWNDVRIEDLDWQVDASAFAGGPAILKCGKRNLKRICLAS